MPTWYDIAEALRLEPEAVEQYWQRPRWFRGEREGVEVEVRWRQGVEVAAVTTVQARIDPPLPFGLYLRGRGRHGGFDRPDGVIPSLGKIGGFWFRRRFDVSAVHAGQLPAFLEAGGERRLLAAWKATRRTWNLGLTDSRAQLVLLGDVSNVRELSEALGVVTELAVDLKSIRRAMDARGAYR